MQRHSQIRLTIALIVVALAPVTRVARAQNPFVFIGGYNETGYVWANSVASMPSRYGISADYKTQDTHAAIPDQNTALGSISTNAILVGHSTGGLVARTRGQNQALRGVITYGTPNWGVPLINTGYYITGYMYWTVYDLGRAVSAYRSLSDPDAMVDDEISWYAELLGPVLSTASAYIIEHVAYSSAILSELNPNSGYIGSGINGGAALVTEGQNVGAQVNVVVSTSNYFYGGWEKETGLGGEYTASVIYVASSLFDAYAINLVLNSEDERRFDVADWILDASDDLFYMDLAWCRSVNGDVAPWGYCGPSDEFVPALSQWSYMGTSYPVTLSLVHQEEAENSAGVLGPVLEQYFGFPH